MDSLFIHKREYGFVCHLARKYYNSLRYSNLHWGIEFEEFKSQLLELWVKERRKFITYNRRYFTNHFKLVSSCWLKRYKHNLIPRNKVHEPTHDLKQLRHDYLAVDSNGKYKYTLADLTKKYNTQESALRNFLSRHHIRRVPDIDFTGVDWYYLQVDSNGKYKYTIKEIAELTGLTIGAVSKYASKHKRKTIKEG